MPRNDNGPARRPFASWSPRRRNAEFRNMKRTPDGEPSAAGARNLEYRFDDPEAIARWNNDGGAPGPLGASRLRFHDAVEFGVHPGWGGGDKQITIIATRAAELKQRRATVVHRDTEVHWPVAEIEAVQKVGRHRKQQLENGIAVTAACTFDPTENEQNRLAICAVGQGNRTAGVSYDLWRFSCEMPDAPHLCNN
jgi:hypothetical protein